MAAAAAMAAAVVLAAVVSAAAAAAAPAEVRWEVSYLTLEPLGQAQKACPCSCCCYPAALSVSVLVVLCCPKDFDFDRNKRRLISQANFRGFRSPFFYTFCLKKSSGKNSIFLDVSMSFDVCLFDRRVLVLKMLPLFSLLRTSCLHRTISSWSLRHGFLSPKGYVTSVLLRITLFFPFLQSEETIFFLVFSSGFGGACPKYFLPCVLAENISCNSFSSPNISSSLIKMRSCTLFF